MFDIGWSEMAVILLVALVVIGPRDLPRVARSVGRWVAKGRAMAREFQTALEDMAREAELDKVKTEIEKAGRTNLGKSIENTIDPTGELGKAFDPNAKSGAKPAKDAVAKPAAAKAVAAKGGKAGAKVDGAEEAAAVPPPSAKPAITRSATARDGKAAAKDAAAGQDAGKGASPAAGRSPAARPEGPEPAVSGPEDAAAGRRRAKAAEREAVPVDPS